MCVYELLHNYIQALKKINFWTFFFTPKQKLLWGRSIHSKKFQNNKTLILTFVDAITMRLLTLGTGIPRLTRFSIVRFPIARIFEVVQENLHSTVLY